MHSNYQCRGTMCIRRQNLVCSCCNRGFVQEELLARGFNARLTDDQRSGSHTENAFPPMISNPNSSIRGSSIDFIGSYFGRGGDRVTDSTSTVVVVEEDNEEVGVIIDRTNRRRQDVDDNGDSGLDTLLDSSSINNRYDALSSAAAASRSSIDALPTIKISQSHIDADSHCPVCKEKFEISTEARLMPCIHIFHSDCIVPWLLLHNSCPVCRFQLPDQASSSRPGVNCSQRTRWLIAGSSNRNVIRSNPISNQGFYRRIRSSGWLSMETEFSGRGIRRINNNMSMYSENNTRRRDQP